MPSPDDDTLLARAGLRALPPAQQGFFRADSWLRRVSAEPVLLLGGGRALLLEVAHPLVAAGVAEHSDFRRDPFGRLQRTLDALGAITFGDRATALAALRRFERAHLRVSGALTVDSGPFPAGTPYAGLDPELLRWVWATLLDTALRVYRHFVGPLEGDALASYYAEQCTLLRLLGVPPALVPDGHAAFRRYFAATLDGPAREASAAAREIAGALLDPALSPVGRGRLRTLTAAWLPDRLREAFGLVWGPEEERRLGQLSASVRALRQAGSVDAGGQAR